MRHGKKFNHLGRKKGHRDALLMNLANSLILHKRINTTLAKAKSLRVFVEPLLTKSKLNPTHSRRMVFADRRQKEVMQKSASGRKSSSRRRRRGGKTGASASGVAAPATPAVNETAAQAEEE